MGILARKGFAIATLVGIAVSLIACHSTYYDVCTQKQQCEGGNDADVQACIDLYQGDESVASAYDCKDAFSKYADCFKVKGSCKNGRYDLSSCSSESQAYASCNRAASGLGK